jgi:S-DNA-T family DNA segregation ATPase FtsK/SpoIIIE
VPLGLEDDDLQPTWVHLVDDGPDFLIVGTPRSGKTSLLTTWAVQLAEANSPERVQFLLMSGRGNSLQSLSALPHVLEHCAGAEPFCREGGAMGWLVDEVRRRESLLEISPQLSHLVVILDDYEQLSYWIEGQPKQRIDLQELARAGNVNLHLLATGPLPNLGGGLFRDPLLRRIRAGRSGFVMCPLASGEQNPLGIRVTGPQVARMIPGRGFVVRRGVAQLLQVAWPGEVSEVKDRVERIKRLWGLLSTGIAG